MKILIADDNRTERTLLRVQLEKAGHETREATDGREALALLAGEGFDALISDILMPNLDGYGLCIEIRKNKKLIHLPVILYTATYVTAADEKLARDVGADRYIRKPAQTQVLLDALTESIAKRKLLRRLPHAKKKPDDVLKGHSEQLIQKIADKNAELEQANRDLREREQRLNSIIENEPECIKILDREGLILQMNPAGLAMVEAESPQDVVGKSVYPIIAEGYRQKFQALNDSVFHGESGQLEFEIVGLKGSRRWMETHAVPMRDEQGQVNGALGLTRDITERKHAEDELRESEQKYRNLIDNMSEGLGVQDKNGLITFMNKRACEMLGYELEELIGRPVTFLFDQENQEILREQLALRRKGVVGSYEIAWSRKDGGKLDTIIAPSPRFDEKGELVESVAVFTDITERKLAEEKLAISETELRVLFEAERNQRALAEALRDTSEILNRTLNIGEVLDAILTNVGRVVPHDTASVRLIDMDRVRIVRSRGFTELGIDIEKLGNELQLSGVNNLQKMVASGHPVLVADTHSDPSWVTLPGTEILRSNIGAPIMIENEVAGFLFLDSLTPGFYTPEHAEHLLAFALQAALAIQKARLYGQAQQEIAERGQVEEALRASETRFRALIENSADLIVVIGTEGLIRFVSPSAERILGYSREEALGRNFLEWIHPDDLPIAMEALNSRREIPGTAESVIELRGLHKNGNWRLVEVLGTNLLADPYVKGIVLNIRDITGRRQAEKEIEQRLAELELLYQSGLAIRLLTNPKIIAETIIELLDSKMDWHHTALRMYHPQEGRFELLAFNQPDMKTEQERRVVEQRFNMAVARTGQGLSGWAVEHRQPVRTGELASDSRYVETFPGLKSGLYVPLMVGERAIGVISIESEQANAFSEADERLTSTLAVQVASALENARLFEQTRRSANEFASLYDTTRDLSMQDDLASTLTTVTLRAAALLGVANASLNLIDSVRAELILAASIGPDLPLGSRRPLGDGLAGHVAQTGAPFIVNDYQNWEHRSRFFEEIPLAAIMGVPLIYGNSVLGVLDISELSPSTRTFGEADVRLLTLFAAQAASAIANTRLYEETVLNLKNLRALRTIEEAIAGSMDIDLILKVILDQVMSEAFVDAVAILLFDPLEQVLKYISGQGFKTEALRHTRLPLGQGYAGKAAASREVIHIPDLHSRNTDFLRSPTFNEEGFVSYFALPLIAKGEIQGVMELFRRKPSDPHEGWLEFMESLARQSAIAIEEATLYKNLQTSNLELALAYDATIEGWSHALDLRDKETEGHTLRVTEMTLDLAKSMNISEKQLVQIRRGALLHDIGKMGVPDQILLKPGALTDEEWVVMKKHPQYAYEMLKPIQFLHPSLDIPYSHHEKWDGTGYPRGLKGEQIPLVARIFAIVDVWDALRSDRPYRAAWARDKALAHIQSGSGSHFDPTVVGAFMKVFAATGKLG